MAIETGTPLAARLTRLASLAAVADAGQGRVSGVPAGATALILVWLAERRQGPVVALTAEPERLHSDLLTLLPEPQVGYFGAADTPAFDRLAPSEEAARRRLAALSLLQCSEPAVVVTSPAAVARPTLTPEALAAARRVRRGERVRPRDLVLLLERFGYRRTTVVTRAGDYAQRGGILDVFGFDRARPWRAEWFGDELDDLRAFDVESQVTVAPLEEVSISPVRELDLTAPRIEAARALVGELDLAGCRDDVRASWERDLEALEGGVYADGIDLFFAYLTPVPRPTLLDHRQAAPIVAVGSRERLLRLGDQHLVDAERLRDQEVERDELPAGALTGLLGRDELAATLDVAMIEVARELDGATVDLGWSGMAAAAAGHFDAVAAQLRARLEAGSTVIAVSRQHHRLAELLGEHNIETAELDDLDLTAALPGGAVLTVSGDLGSGYDAPSLGLSMVGDSELFGVVKHRASPVARGGRRVESTSGRGQRRAASGRAAAQAYAMQFAPGDVVVHRDHGVGRFVEMTSVADDDGGLHEYMTLEYAEGHRLHVPVEHLDRVDRYVGGSEGPPTLSKLGTGEWERTKRRVKERTEEVARELLGLYTRRELAPGHAFNPDGTWQRELEDSFPYQETADQILVMEEIKRDMEASKPMDRVVCGDVGFGKTELALRAAFKAASEGHQVAVLVPTTILAQQHYATFTERLRAFPLTIAQLSRFCTDEEARATLLGLQAGTVDIVIGTHRLLQRSVHFKNLGLVIVDEEQRFGVLQKERFKELRVGVDLLSLSATPIPRTLHMSLAGIRDLSVIQSPPEERQPIKTYVVAREDTLIREVITREMARGGQTYFVHNRVQSIEAEAEALRTLVPEARIAVGHGQMDEHHLAAVMQAFSEGEIDVLVATTIVESGLDIPNANTLIVNDAHRFGLAQLYQLRGRVGRSGHRAYAYFLYPPGRSLTERADKRLDVIADLQDLGAGFRLAMRDLEIRGAGNLLGEEQHGEIAAVGMEMYNHLLRQAVAALQGRPVTEAPAQVTVSLPLPAYLPPAYVADEKLRLRCYQDLAGCATEMELEQRTKGLRDRFGPLPPPAENLAYSLRVRLLAAACGATAVDRQQAGIVIQFPPDHHLDLPVLVHQFRPRLSSTPTRVILSQEPNREQPWEELLLSVLRELGRLRRVQQRVGAT